jgi:putative ABC transport system ATP-binding protein
VQANNGKVYGEAVIEALSKSFGRGDAETPILKNIDLQIFPGEFVALIGPSGSGKSTLLSILGLLEPPSSGDVLVAGQSVKKLSRRQLARLRGRKLGYVFQSFNLLAGLSVAENVMLSGLLVGESGRAQYDRAIELLDQFGLAEKAKRVPSELSGGEQQRVAIARALFMKPDVILADEPTGNLDTKNGRKVIETLETLNEEGQTIVLVTHDLSIETAVGGRCRNSKLHGVGRRTRSPLRGGSSYRGHAVTNAETNTPHNDLVPTRNERAHHAVRAITQQRRDGDNF